MNTRKLLVTLVTLSLWSVGCQKLSFNALESNDEDSGSQSLHCKTETGYIDPAGLQIEGANTAQKGEPVVYQLNQDLGCSNSQAVSWKTIASGEQVSAKSGTNLRSAFNKAGEYVVTARIANKETAEVSVISYKTVVVSNAVAISGPTLGMVGTPLTYELAIPAGVDLSSAEWNFGDGAAVVNSLVPVSHTYGRPGEYVVSVVAKESNGNETRLSQKITVLMIQDGLECVSDLALSGATEGIVGVPVSMSLFIPSCLTNKITALNWNFGDGGTAANQSVQHTYQAAGQYNVLVDIFVGSSTTPWVTLTHSVRVTAPPVDPTPTPSPTPDVSPTPSPTPDVSPTPTPTPSPTPDNDPNACSILGQTREDRGEIYSETVACGLQGTKIMSYRDVVRDQCKAVNDVQRWVEVSRTKELQNEGACQGQSCTLADGSVIKHNTTKSGVVIGEIKLPLTCAAGETGYFNLVHQIADMSCNNNTVTSSNTREGDIKVAGSCPTYKWTATDEWSACSANCGGKQTRNFVCKSSTGQVVGANLCTDVFVPEERVCDGNPEAVRRQEQTVTADGNGSSKSCPANQIGVIITSREVITTTTYACIDHQVKQESQNVTYGNMKEEKYCRDFVSYRCSQDPLSNDEAQGRYAWMQKCQDQVPMIKEFLQKMANVKYRGQGIGSQYEALYPTFMNRATSPEKPWIAPVKQSGSCSIPDTVYIAAVCVSSCALPQEQILGGMNASGGVKYTSFIESLNQKFGYVATLKEDSSMNSKAIEKTAVDQWVTELIDSNHEILVFTMKSGRQLNLTTNHPVLNDQGLMKLASEFKVGDNLVMLGGDLDPIVSLEKVNHFGKVYNVFVKSDEVHKNIVVTNGYLNGTAFFQNQGAMNMNRDLFRDRMTEGVFNK